MDLQKTIFKKYFEAKGKKTLREMAEETGINLSRIFRLLNGCKMRLDEYEKFDVVIKGNNKNQLKDLIEDCDKKLSVITLKEIEMFINRKIDLWQLQNENVRA